MTVIKIWNGDEDKEKEKIPLLKDDIDVKPVPVSAHRIELLPFNPKLIYFTLNMALYSSLTFTSAYFFERWGLPIYQFGALSSLSIVELIGAMWWGGFTDRSGRHREILLGCTWMYCGCFACCRSLNGFYRMKTRLDWNWPCQLFCWAQHTLHVILLSACRQLRLEGIEERTADNPGTSDHVSFGKQRLWGRLGMQPFRSFLRNLFRGSMERHVWCNDPHMCSLFPFIIYTIPDGQTIEITDNDTETSNLDDNDSTWNFLFKFDFLLFLFVVLLSGYMRSILSIFLPYHLLIDLKQTPMFVGMTAVFRISAEILIFAYIVGKNIARIHRGLGTRAGEVKLVLFGLAAGVLRVAGYSVLEWLEESSGVPCGL